MLKLLKEEAATFNQRADVSPEDRSRMAPAIRQAG